MIDSTASKMCGSCMMIINLPMSIRRYTQIRTHGKGSFKNYDMSQDQLSVIEFDLCARCLEDQGLNDNAIEVIESS